ncbi:MAG: M48 family metalloprotease [Actinobacteria bacterium]|nr:M48 family metalloprotease [Actinomycetota bacterium]
MSAGARRARDGLGRPRPLAVVALVAGALLWALAARALWHTTIPDGMRLPHADPHTAFGAGFLRRSASYERFLAIDALLGVVVAFAALVVYARRGQRLTAESAAGPIGTGMLLGMLGLGIVWLAELPFDLAALWWERRHDVVHVGYVEHVVNGFFGLSGPFAAISLALLLAMGLARVLRGWWWVAAAPCFAALALLLGFVSPYLLTIDSAPLDQRPGTARTAADARALARREGVPDTPVFVDLVPDQPNAAAVGLGPTRRVVVRESLLRRFDRREVRVVLAHELGHLQHRHTLKSVGWLALFVLPAAGVVALATRRRGGLARPEAVPVALLALVAFGVAAQPLLAATTRRLEAEADWAALQTTHDPAGARALFRHLATATITDPDPPVWRALLGDHPTIMQRIELASAWEARAGQR